MEYSLIKWPQPGNYILAISGGADSMVMLNVFAAAAQARGYSLTVAHFDHGLRHDSAEDATFVAHAADHLGLPFLLHTATLGSASEGSARSARYAWLQKVCAEVHANAILTAHHQNDVVETSLLNLARGSGRLGLAPMQVSRNIARPFLQLSRAGLREYAQVHQVTWREDPTNTDITNARNVLRQVILPAASESWYLSYRNLIVDLATLNKKIDQTISILLVAHKTDEKTYTFPTQFIDNRTQIELKEILLAAARSLSPGVQLDRALVEQAVNLMRRGHTGQLKPLRLGLVLYLHRGYIRLTTNSPV